MSTPASPSLPVFRALLMAAMGGTAAGGCGPGKNDAPNDETDITDVTPVPGGSNTGTTDTPVIPCTDPFPLTDAAGDASGYVQCADGAVLRVDGHLWPEGGLCRSDGDCDTGEVCIGDNLGGMGGATAYCIPASCETGADCDSGECGLSVYDDGCGTQATVTCRTPGDSCRGDADCEPGMDQCVVTYWSEEVWVCASMDCAIGRPLFGSTEPTTPTRPRLHKAPGDPAERLDLGSEERRVLAAWWAYVGQMEHASIASFARVTFELMSLGAPADILLGVQQAAADEVRHASVAFALASRFAGTRLSAGPLPTDQVAPRQGPAEILRALVLEACVVETVGVAEARAALAGCTDPAVRSALETIVEDETRHAALAWRTLSWLLERHPELAQVAEAAFSEGVAQRQSAPPSSLPSLPTWGLLGPQRRRKVCDEAVQAVVLPCAREVLRRVGRGQSPEVCVTHGRPPAPAPRGDAPAFQ